MKIWYKKYQHVLSNRNMSKYLFKMFFFFVYMIIYTWFRKGVPYKGSVCLIVQKRSQISVIADVLIQSPGASLEGTVVTIWINKSYVQVSWTIVALGDTLRLFVKVSVIPSAWLVLVAFEESL